MQSTKGWQKPLKAMSKIRVGIIGGAGYTGGELLRLVLGHPNAEVAFIHSRSHAGQPVFAVHDDLLGETELTFSAAPEWPVDVLFLCVGHGEAKKFLEENDIPAETPVIDLSQDFRLTANSIFKERTFTYGLPEANRELIRTAKNIANPGCFATAIQLALLPLAANNLLQHEVHITGITGATGAGQKLQSTSHFPWRANNISAYKSLTHQHMGEVTETLQNLQPACGKIQFIPWRGDFARGIYVSAYTLCDLSLEDAFAVYERQYSGHPFTHVSRAGMHMKQVVNTNKCIVHLEKEDGQLIIHSSIDNLLKGASGQALQNMNLMFGLPEDAGVRLKSIVF